jgi:hypothetical protein
MEEIWKDIEGYEGLYQVSNMGNVKNLKTNRVLKSWKEGVGYLKIKLSKNNNHTRFKIHRLVAIAFLPNPNNYKMINHKDEIKTNNNIENLEWCNNSYNTRYGKKRQYSSNKVPVRCIETGEVFESLTDAGHAVGSIGINAGRGVYQACKGILKTFKGFHWELVIN